MLDLNNLKWSDLKPRFDDLISTPLNADSMGEFLHHWSDLEKQLNESVNLAYRARTENTVDAEAAERYERLVTEVQPQAKAAAQALRDRVLSVPGYKPRDDESDLFRRFAAQRDLYREANLPVETELALLAARYDEIVGAMSVTLDGATLTMAAALQRLENTVRVEREAAWREIMARFAQDRSALDELFLRMLPLRRQLATNAGLSD